MPGEDEEAAVKVLALFSYFFTESSSIWSWAPHVLLYYSCVGQTRERLTELKWTWRVTADFFFPIFSPVSDKFELFKDFKSQMNTVKTLQKALL